MVSVKNRLALDAVIFVATLLSMAYTWTGTFRHELVGTVAVVGVIAHLFINRRWYGKAFTTKGVPMNGWRKTLNCLLLFVTLGMTVSSMLLSKYLFAFLGFGGANVGLTPHLICGYWGFLIMALHIGMHGSMLLAQWKKTALGKWMSARSWVGKALAVVAIVYGAYGLWVQEYGAHLFMRIGTSDLAYPHGFWLFTAEQLAIVGLFAVAIYYYSQWKNKRRIAKARA